MGEGKSGPVETGLTGPVATALLYVLHNPPTLVMPIPPVAENTSGANEECLVFCILCSLEPRLSILDFVSIFHQSCETKSGTESLGSRLYP